ncbi:MAG: DUF1648 domain-containing protein [Bryobacteraceae bacterium]
MFPNRPRIAIPMTPVRLFVEAAALSFLLALLAFLYSQWPGIPERVPVKFGFSGEVVRWGSKQSLLTIPAVAVFLYVAMTVVGRMPHIFNYPAGLNAKNAPRLYAAGVSLIAWTKAEMVVLFGAMSLGQVAIALGMVRSLGPWFFPLFLAAPAATALLHILRMRAAAK